MTDEGGRPRPRILLVDDEPDWLKLLSIRIGNSGWETVCAASGEEALERFDAGPGVQAAVMDQRMPGLVGTEVAAKLRKRGYDGPIIIFSAQADAALQRTCTRLGIQAISKMADDALHRMLAIYRAEIVGAEEKSEPVIEVEAEPEGPAARGALRRIGVGVKGGRR